MRGAALWAGLAYFALVFAAGFVLGTLRVLAMVPLLGESAAVILEVPVMLAISWVVCASLTRRFTVPPEMSPRLVMGGVAFVLLLAAEIILSATVFGRGPVAFANELAKPTGAAGFAGQVLFAHIPWIQARRQT